MDANKMQAKGFTLIELLVVLAIVAILSVVVILTLNPAELLKQARDSNRISDLGTMKSALSLYLADVSSPALTNGGNFTTCFETATGTNAKCGSANAVFIGGVITSASSSANRSVDGSGWIPVNLAAISSGAPISQLPIDPVNNSTYFYAYAASSTNVFEMDAVMESAKYGGATGVMGTDGGDNNNYYEVGTNLKL